MAEVIKIGVTERGDPAWDKSWVQKLQRANIVITKNVRRVTDELLENQDRCILHATITGLGGTVLEPNVPVPNDSIDAVVELISKGFPARQVVLRVDPVIPEGEWLEMAERVISAGSTLARLGVPRMRYSFIDLYPHVKERLKEAGVQLFLGSAAAKEKYGSDFTLAGQAARDMAARIERLGLEAGFLNVAACGEFAGNRIGCVSFMDLRILGIDPALALPAEGLQRKTCLCCANKTELLGSKHRCPHSCLYCYWRD